MSVPSQIDKNKKAVVLITALWILALLTFLALNLVYRVRLSMSLTDHRIHAVQADAFLDAGLAQALTAIRNDYNIEVDSLQEDWAKMRSTNHPDAITQLIGNYEDLELRWKVSDEGSKLNLNTIEPELISELFNVYYSFDVDVDTAVESIVDWIDTDNYGVGESDYYSSLPVSYTPRNDVIPVMEEVLSIREITSWLYWGEDFNLNNELDDVEDDGNRHPPYDNGDGQIQPGLCNLFTVYGEGELNVNTVSQPVLEAVFKTLLDQSAATEKANILLKARSGADGVSGTDDDTPFQSHQQIGEVIGVPLYQQAKNRGVQLTVASNAFSVDVYVNWEKERVVRRGYGLVFRLENETKLAFWRKHPV